MREKYRDLIEAGSNKDKLKFIQKIAKGRKKVSQKEFEKHVEQMKDGATKRGMSDYSKNGKFVAAWHHGRAAELNYSQVYSHEDHKQKGGYKIYDGATKKTVYYLDESVDLNEKEMKFQALAMAKELHNSLAGITFIDMLAVMNPNNPAKKEVQDLETKVNAITTEVGEFIQKYIPDVADADIGDLEDQPEPEPEEEEDKEEKPKKVKKKVQKPKAEKPMQQDDAEEEEEEPVKENLDEARATNIMGLIQEISKLPSIDKRVDVWSQIDGMAGLYRAKDGNAYEITIRPASEAKHPGIQRKTGKKMRESFRNTIVEKADDKVLKGAEKLIIKLKKAKKNNNDIIKALEVNYPSINAMDFLANFKNEKVK